MSKSIDREISVAFCYRRLAGTAKRFRYEFQLPAVKPGEPAVVLFVGNHSSGKSTYINHLMEGASIQDTGVAPTDDGFTVLKYAEEERDIVGPAALAELGPEFARLGNLGPKFLDRLRVRYRDRPVLLKTMLVDSPGMLDATERKIEREYDFFAALSIFAEAAAMVVVMFDPDKPGTTGETVDALSGPLADKTSKLHLVMNRCDELSGIYDYGRAYGSLCWNLAHALQIKDLPKIYPCRVPTDRGGSGTIDTAFMDAAREEMSAKIRNASETRAASVLASAQNDLNRLLIQVRMATVLSRSCLALRLSVLLVAMGGLSFPGFRLMKCLLSSFDMSPTVVGTGVGLLVAVVSFLVAEPVSKMLLCMWRCWLSASLDRRFERMYRAELETARREDLRQYWDQTRPNLRRLLSSGWEGLPAFGWLARRRVADELARLTA